jgi:hypothetical protein
MGQAKVKKRSTADFVANFPLCSLCGGDRPTTTREHMPPRSLFDNKHRPDKLVMPACLECNNGTSTSDLTASMVSRWGTNESPQTQADHSNSLTDEQPYSADRMSHPGRPKSAPASIPLTCRQDGGAPAALANSRCFCVDNTSISIGTSNVAGQTGSNILVAGNGTLNVLGGATRGTRPPLAHIEGNPQMSHGLASASVTIF